MSRVDYRTFYMLLDNHTHVVVEHAAAKKYIVGKNPVGIVPESHEKTKYDISKNIAHIVQGLKLFPENETMRH